MISIKIIVATGLMACMVANVAVARRLKEIGHTEDAETVSAISLAIKQLEITNRPRMKQIRYLPARKSDLGQSTWAQSVPEPKRGLNLRIE